jgi:hypothetical protein
MSKFDYAIIYEHAFRKDAVKSYADSLSQCRSARRLIHKTFRLNINVVPTKRSSVIANAASECVAEEESVAKEEKASKAKEER